eukprot:TRINITY_DN8516_c0_g1_i2.p1 TRINITY_DN8516_c0_g1~~TRINITY_DN8516_c0_g1_i2.p1  ORF type:complete len:425 (+),score=93.02 TRINITY_DN8516_c0_g1_i2:90-1277(+)
MAATQAGGCDACGPHADCFETFPELRWRRIPLIVFHDKRPLAGERLLAEHVVVRHTVCLGSIENGTVRPDTGHTTGLDARWPVAMSPAYLGFAIEPYMERYLHYDGVGIAFARPSRATFMAPSIDTVLMCAGLKLLFAEVAHAGKGFNYAVDVGSGSAFIAKYAAMRAPGTEELHVAAVDIDPLAEEYARSAPFAAPKRQQDGAKRAVCFEPVCADASAWLRQNGSRCDLVISNPPYIPTPEEIRGAAPPTPEAGEAFWMGVGLLVDLIGKFTRREFAPASERCAPHLVLIVSSLSLKAGAVRSALETACASRCQLQVLLEREVAWKAWYAGGSDSRHLMMTEEERTTPLKIGGARLWSGAAPPGQPRMCCVEDGRRDHVGYHWHVLHVISLSYV